MKASDLRIGNFISSYCPISVVIGIDYEGVVDTAYYEHGKGVDYTSEWHSNEGSINPIPLTEEWLVKFGFHSIQTKFEKYYNEHGQMVSISQHRSWGDNKIISYSISNGGIEINHVHQLQNLYHALTAEELTINED